MTVGQLMDILSDFDTSCEVRLMSQPSYPFEYSIQGVASSNDFAGDQDYDDEEEVNEQSFDDMPTEIAYIIEGNQLGYGNKDAWDVVRSH